MDTIITYADPDPAGVEKLSNELDCHPVTAALLWARGCCTPEEANFFLAPTLEHLSDPFSLKDMDKAVKRIYSAVSNNEKILIFGDFDADGVTATSLLFDFLNIADADLTWYVPHRIKEGYSIGPDHITMAADMNVDLIITVDCGITSIEAVKAANLEDIDVIITDHHEPGPVLPPALALVDPKQKECTSGLDHLAGVGVAFFLVMALRKHFREKKMWEQIQEPNLFDFLDLFAIGTIGDMVPLIKENRVLCMIGLKKMRTKPRPGIQALARAARIDSKQMDSDDISFKIVPRINAAGRISHARICVSLLTCQSLAEADKTAILLDELNQKRQVIEKEIVLDIENRILRDSSLLKDRLLLLWDQRWTPSVLGIVASKLSKKFFCPVVLLSSANDMAVGSCRSINNINIHTALAQNSHLLEKFGGHTMAAGLTLAKKNLPDLTSGLITHLKDNYTDQDFLKTLAIDARLDFEEIDFFLAREIDRLRPFGMANPEPVFLCRRLKVVSSCIIGRNHRKMILQSADSSSGHRVEAFHFNVLDTNNLPDYYDRIVFRLKINKFKPDSAQIIIQDL